LIIQHRHSADLAGLQRLRNALDRHPSVTVTTSLVITSRTVLLRDGQGLAGLPQSLGGVR
jgi:hypothetical protein